MPRDRLDVYFSLRSPYAWLGLLRLSQVLERYSPPVSWHPIWPRQDLPFADPVANPAKASYLVEDVGRQVLALGLGLKWPRSIDTDWKLPHACCLVAADEGLALPFALDMFSLRFSHGRDLADRSVIADAAGNCGLDAEQLTERAGSQATADRLDACHAGARRKDIFGVPFFVYGKKRYWGGDRVDWLLRQLMIDNGDMKDEALAYPLAAPHGSR